MDGESVGAEQGLQVGARVSAEDKTIMEYVLAELNPAAIQRQVQTLTARAAHPDHQQGRRRRETGCSGPGSARIRS